MSGMVEERVARDGTRLTVRTWPVEDPWATVLIVHGLGEHSGRYAHVATALNDAGLTVGAFDLRGHGRSGGERGYVKAWKDYLDDVEDRLAEMRRPGTPVVLYGHSLGGLIVLSYAESQRPQPDAVVASSPALLDDLPAVLHLLPKVLGPILPKLSVATGITGDQLSSDPVVGEAYFADPLVLTKVTLRLAAESLAAQKRTREHLDAIRVPVLTFHGSDDTLVPPAASELLTPYAKRIVYQRFRHECHNEPGAEKVFDDVVEWLREQFQA